MFVLIAAMCVCSKDVLLSDVFTLMTFAGMQRTGLNRFAKVTSSTAQLVADLGGQGGYLTSYGHFPNGCINSGIQIYQQLGESIAWKSKCGRLLVPFTSGRV